jgi:hypothetical protein
MQELIARRSDMLVMSSDGPISAYVNAHGYVHETVTLSNAYGLFEDGDAQTENNWFPGYVFSPSFSAFSMPSQLWCITFNNTSMCNWFYDALYCWYPSLVSLFHMSNFRKASGFWLMGTHLLHGLSLRCTFKSRAHIYIYVYTKL